MKERQQTSVVAWCLLFVLSLGCLAHAEPITERDSVGADTKVDRISYPLDLYEELRLPTRRLAARAGRGSTLLDLVSLRKLPRGSLRTRFDGPFKLLVKYSRRHFRKHWNNQREQVSAWWSAAREVRHQQYISDLWATTGVNGQWFTRRWWESLPPEKGGAPATPYEHTVGREVEFRVGPVSVTNTLRFKLDYVAVFDVNPDPTMQVDPTRPPEMESRDRVSVDVRPIGNRSTIGSGSQISFKVRPHVRIGLPRGGEWHSVLRRVSIRAEFSVTYFGREVIRGECEVRFKAPDDALVTVQLALLNW